jgi:hypothetical protein
MQEILSEDHRSHGRYGPLPIYTVSAINKVIWAYLSKSHSRLSNCKEQILLRVDFVSCFVVRLVVCSVSTINT